MYSIIPVGCQGDLDFCYLVAGRVILPLVFHGHQVISFSLLYCRPQYIDWDSKLLAPVVCFAKLVKTGLWNVLGRTTCSIHLISASDQPGWKEM